jgi:cytochrome c
MSSSLEMNKIAAAVLTAGIVAMGSGFVAELLVGGGHGHMEENAYPIQVAESGGEAESAPQEPTGPEPVLPLLAEASASDGEGLTRACQACHSFEQGGPNKVGPNLWNIVGAPHAHAEGFSYSDALSSMHDKAWTYSELNAFIADPKGYAPGTKMSYGGMSKVEDRADLIAYLRSLSDDPAPLPTQEEIDAVTGGGEEEAAAQEEAASEAEPAAEAEAAANAEAGAEGATQEASADAGGTPPYLQMIADADPAAGEKQIRACAACHSFEQGGPNKVGPNLYDVVGKPVAHLEGFNYSSEFQEKHEAGETWTYEHLWAFLQNPKEWAPGTRMTFAGVRKEEDKAAIIAYMRSLSENPAPLEPLN